MKNTFRFKVGDMISLKAPFKAGKKLIIGKKLYKGKTYYTTIYISNPSIFSSLTQEQLQQHYDLITNIFRGCL